MAKKKLDKKEIPPIVIQNPELNAMIHWAWSMVELSEHERSEQTERKDTMDGQEKAR